MRRLLSLLIAAGIGAATLLIGASLVTQWVADRAATRAMVAKDVTADVLPPPMYLVELRLVLAMAMDGSLTPARAQQEWARLEREYLVRAEYWRANPPYGLEESLLGGQHKAAERFLSASRVVLTRLRSDDRAGAEAALSLAHTRYLEHRAGVDSTVAKATAFATSAMERVETVQRVALLLSLLVFALAVFGMHRMGRWVAASVFRATGGEPEEVARIARRVAAGDLTVAVPVRAGDNESVMAAMAVMVAQLRSLVETVRASSNAIAAGSEQIAAGGSDLSSRTQSQLATVHGTLDTMTGVLGTVAQTSDAAHEAHVLADAATRVADRGAEAVREVVDTMAELSNQSRQIAQITAMIDDIAAQTNLLALNAAVEAARAGEQGRGFAVVAGEVRELAHRSAEAARQISQLTQSSLAQVNAGTATAARAGERMDAVAVELQRMRESLERIGAAAVAQRDGIGAARGAMDALERVAEENAALVVESAEAAADLRSQAKELVGLVGVFRLAA